MPADVAALNRQAAQLRQQAQALHQASASSVGLKTQNNTIATFEAQRAVTRLEAEANAAQQQAEFARRQAAEVRADADKQVADAENAAGGDPTKLEEARELATRVRAGADGYERAAETAEARLLNLRQQAETARAEFERVADKGVAEQYTASKQMEAVADELDRKAAYLQDAADTEQKAIDAEAAGDHQTALEQRELVDYALKRADNIQPDVSGIDPKELRDAGVELSTAPGTALIDPDVASADTAAELDGLKAVISDSSRDGDQETTDLLHDLTDPVNHPDIDTPASAALDRLTEQVMTNPAPELNADNYIGDAATGAEGSSDLTATPAEAAVDSYTAPSDDGAASDDTGTDEQVDTDSQAEYTDG